MVSGTTSMALEQLEHALDFLTYYETKVAEAAAYVRGQLGERKPQFGVVLGSGLGDLAETIKNVVSIPYASIPHFPTTTIPGHEGTLLMGDLEGVPVIALKGRKHYYEVADALLGTGILQVVFPVHVLAELGVPNYFATNAAGGLNADYAVGDIMVIRSHINFIPNALLGRNKNFKPVDSDSHVERFQPMNGAYDPAFRKLLLEAGSAHTGHVHEGVYIAVTGPSYETEGECIAFRDGWKADAVGMSTTPEVLVARNRGMRVVGMSCITNKIAPDGTNATNHEEVKAILESPAVCNRLSLTVMEFFRLYRESADSGSAPTRQPSAQPI